MFSDDSRKAPVVAALLRMLLPVQLAAAGVDGLVYLRVLLGMAVHVVAVIDLLVVALDAAAPIGDYLAVAVRVEMPHGASRELALVNGAAAGEHDAEPARLRALRHAGVPRPQPVTAPTDTIWVYDDGKIETGREQGDYDGTWKTLYPKGWRNDN